MSIIKIVSHKLANYIVSATLDTQTEGCFKSPTDVDELKNSFFFSATLNQCNLSLVTNHYILSFFIASIDESIPYGSFGHCRALPTPFRQSGTNYARAIKKEWRKKIPLSKLCHAHVISLLHNPMKDSTIYLLVQTNWEKCTHSVTLHLSDSEYDTLTKRANGSPLSRYIRSILLHHSEPIHIEVYTEDISILTMQVSGYIQRLYSFIAALAIRQQLYEADYNHLIQIASDTQKVLRDVANYAKANRSSIRATGVRILRKEIKKAVEKQMQK